MGTLIEALVATLSFLVILGNSRSTGTKRCDGVASYELVLKTFWSKEVFHKQYPTFRPHAQWSKLIGRSHSRRYSLWSDGQLATEALKEFTEKGLSTALDVEAQGSKGIFDSFFGANIPEGVGSSVVKFLIHPKYPKMSFIVRMIPSPDWFIGVDSLDLCADGHWAQEKKLDLHPMDGGTDRGYTFTSPHWPESDHKPIYTITSKFPNHQANSFYYPGLVSLPPIAQFKLTRINLTWDDTGEEPRENKPEINSVRSSDTQSVERKLALALLGDREIGSDSSRKNSTTATFPRKLVKILSRNIYKTNGTRQLRSGDGSYVITRTRVPSISGGNKVDCQVSDWSDWSSCSKTCGFSVRYRTRYNMRRPRNGGQQCPSLRDIQRCDMPTCDLTYDSHLNVPADSPTEGDETEIATN